MTGLHAVLLGVVLAASPDAVALDGPPKEAAQSSDVEAFHGRWAKHKTERPCVIGSREARQAGELLRSVDRAQRVLEEGSSTATFVQALGELRRHRCFAWAVGWPRTDEAEALQLRDWWTVGGERWLRSVLQYSPKHRKVVLPPDLRERLSGVNRFLLANLTCSAGSPACAPGDAWRARADAALKTEQAACRPEPTSCELPSSSVINQSLSWLRCNHATTGRSIELPPDSIKPPSEGWLVVRHRREENDVAASCLAAASYSLATGDAWILDTCDQPEARIGRVPVVPLRELALLLVVSDDLQRDVRTRALEVELPKGLELGWKGGIIGGTQGRVLSHTYGYSFLPKTSWRVWTERAEKLGSFQTQGCDPLARVAAQWLRQLDATLGAACTSAVPPPDLFATPDSGSTVAWERELERQTYQRLGARMRERTDACSGDSSKKP